MPNNSNVSRRRFLKPSGALTGASLLKIGTPALIAITEAACSAKQEAAPFANLNVADAADLAAIAARIMPTTDTPGATEAGAKSSTLASMIPLAEGRYRFGKRRGNFAAYAALCQRATPGRTRQFKWLRRSQPDVQRPFGCQRGIRASIE